MAAALGLRHRSRTRSGLTLIEVLIALFVFAIVITIAGSGIVQALRVQSLNETNASLQGKLRRITEVVSQDLRSAVLGALTNAPYATGAGAVSFTLADGGQGYEILRTAGVSANQFPNAADFRVVAQAASAADLGLVGQRVLLVNGVGDAASFDITSAASDGAIGNNRWVLGHAGCLNTVAWVDPMRMFAVDAVGYRLANSGDLMRQVSGRRGGGARLRPLGVRRPVRVPRRDRHHRGARRAVHGGRPPAARQSAETCSTRCASASRRSSLRSATG